MAIKVYKHSKSHDIAVIKSPYTDSIKILYGDDWSLKNWNKIIKFWSNHPIYSIELE